MKENIGIKLEDWLLDIGLSVSWSEILSVIIIVLAIGLLSWLGDFLTKKILMKFLKRVVSRTKTLWDDILLEKNVFHKVAHFVPAIIVFYTIEYAFPNATVLVSVLEKLSLIYIVFVAIKSVDAVLNGADEIYNKSKSGKKGSSIKSYIQVVKIIFYVLAIVVVLSILLNKNVGFFLTGMGAMAAVLMLVFKDSILGLVAGIQLSSNDMLRIGDWISMPSRNADGVVLDISLHTVKVTNWDKTIATVPTYALVQESYNNWRGMEESGVRRISRSVNIDMGSVHFCTPEEIATFGKIHRIKDYISTTQAGLSKFNKENKIDETVVVNGRRQTNLGVFRNYLEAYLRNNPNINTELTLMVRQLEPSETGIPIQIYVFSKVQAWVEYEGIQSDIFDHILAVIPEFGLKVFQHPTGSDFRNLK